MWIFNFYRLYFAIFSGIVCYFFLFRKWWAGLIIAIVFRLIWWIIESIIKRIVINITFKKYSSDFKQKFGPYGIRIINKGEQDYNIRKSLFEVFTDNKKRLSRVIEDLEMMDTIFKAGLRPEGDEYLLHDLKLKYAKEHLNEIKNKE